jgi:hypothetical protein
MMGGAQAQVVSAAEMSLWARVRDVRAGDVQAAVRDRELVKAWCMRRTLHLVPARDLAVFVRGTAGRAERNVTWFLRQGMSERLIDTLVRAALDALDRPITGPELIERVCRALRRPVRMMRWDGWGRGGKVPGVPVGRLTLPVRHVFHLVAARGVVCSGPSRGVQPTFVRADAWIPRWRDLPQQDAETELLRRYLRAFGPATPADFALWTGMAQRRARDIWSRLDADIAPVDVEGWSAAVLRRDLPALTAGRSGGLPVRLLPYFDSYLLGHRSREHLIEIRHHRRVYRTAGWIAPVVLVDGRVAGTWTHEIDGARLTIGVTLFAPASARAARGIRDEAERLSRFFGARGADVRTV